MSVEILMPALSPTMEKGNLAKWLKKEGDKVAPGDVIAEIETDKATMEVEAIDEGTLAKIVVPEGTADVPVNQLIAVLATEGEDVKVVAAGSGSAPAKAEAPKAEAAPAAQTEAPKSVAPKPEEPKAAAPVAASGERVFASPLARRLAKEKGVELSGVKGSGPHGRVIAADVETAPAGGAAKAPAAASAPATAPAAAPAPVSNGALLEQVKAYYEPGTYEEIPLDGMRRVIAQRMAEARQTVPTFYLTVDCDVDALLKLREELNKAAPEKDGKAAYKLSVNDFVIKAYALAFQQVPDANQVWGGDRYLKLKHSDIGVAVAIDGGKGLLTPIIRKAETKTLSAISNETRELATRARNKKLAPAEYQGGSSAISNLGMFGIKDFTAIINPPHATILAVGASEPRAVVKKGELAVATVMTVTISCDHRVMDGAMGAQLIGAFKQIIEKPMSMLV
ncbi:pyruvate dehydrogenase complex dihydrolipoamide acetyltransferase [Ancylobacter dichloromethanicus]|uniref:Acetyltransferase component of pyruvate dehydrogenase complex n=1 Tax=Ancylobacter dichloromethanicus TaxID=518825 RepID=A0A9W6MY75_9HYPH|nr:pyruvate dehydrogenase complex dihydrolipoamide acetyltransferase [Ancylobacter dichloromethanicus]MBS7554242.1 pyruvate dehydrogenase complex dihydrolipoamide acetyltransferase [Ancylobacter dichloromethanicus]GLK71364.1 acetyltransferase component of pyruvate dehydrogenase complex [Ancylobacter dichloromethanicus]